MKFDDIDNRFLARYMAGDCTPDEEHKVKNWISADVKNKEKVEQFKRIWDSSEKDQSAVYGMFGTDEQWKKLQKRLKKEGELPSNKQHSYAKKYRSSSIHSMTQKVVRIAAIFLLAALIGVFAYQNWYSPEPKVTETVLREVSTANAQRVNLTLGDGTKVMLNAGSSMRFPEKFETDIREVYLKGEAYFKVKSNSERPFIIHSRGTKIRVLGTAFTVRSYEEDKNVRVVVEEGRVSFTKTDSMDTAKRLLTAQEMGAYELGSDRIRMTKVEDMQLYLSWKKGYLKFNEEPMAHVAKSLERRYGIEVSFENSEIKNKELTAYLKSRSIKNVLNVIAMSLDIEYELAENRVTFLRTK
ncbi:FecR family protein [Fodinibius saliphilus]|uniref:FecR family protein n=1 Tax=Fodinibius saliphilus TaxID=1920650 RepID=UPI001108A4BC|nr:FecR family protein [Fodinibius saliphilus]